jgi:hypothetical protein
MTKYTSEQVRPYVYMGIHKITGEIYVGYREANTLPSHLDLYQYRTSSKVVKPNFDEYDWFIIAEFSNGNDAYDFEQSLILEHWENSLLLNGYCHKQGKRFKRNFQTEETKRKISEKAKGRTLTAEHKQKVSAGGKGKLRSENTKQKMRKPKSESHKSNMKKYHQELKEYSIKNGIPLRSDQTRQRMAESKSNMTEDQRNSWIAKMSANSKGMVSAFDLTTRTNCRVTKDEFIMLKNIRYVGIKSKLKTKAG